MQPAPLSRRLVAEFIGTAMLLAAIVGSGIAAERLSPHESGLELLENAVATAAALVAIIMAFGPVSGAHLNPLISVADAVLGGLTAAAAASYVVAQFAGAVVGALVANLPAPRACTPAGILELLKRGGIPIAGRRAVVVGRSDIVGKPVAFLLLHQHATVTICHSKTPDLPAVCREADILVAAIGRAAMITRDFIRQGATVIDVGTNYIQDRDLAARIFRNSPEKLASFDRRGSVLVGDVDPIDVVERAGAYTPVPGGVGPLTIAMLMVNTVASAERRSGVC